MNKRRFTRVTALLLITVMLVSLLPMGVLAYESSSNLEYIEGGSAEKERYELLGYGFNALSDTKIGDTTLKSDAGIVIDHDAVKASVLSTSASHADVKYTKSAQEMMMEFGIDYSNQTSVGLPISNAKVGFSAKFGFSTSEKYESFTESIYYYYREEMLTGKYSLLLSDRLLDQPHQIISSDFLYALEKLSNNYSDTYCAEFFDRWGTHILVSYNKGAALEYVAVGHSTGNKFSTNTEIENELSASVGVGDLKAETTQSTSVKLDTAFSNSEYNLTHKWFGLGGASNLISANGTDASEITGDSIAIWKETVSQADSVLIPQSTEWISIWELIPDTYAGAKIALQEYYKKQVTGVNAAFFSKFTTYSKVTGETDLYYTAPSGYTSRIAYYADRITKVAPGSKFNVVPLGTDLSNIVFPASSQYTVDQYGMVTMLAESGTVTVMVTDLEGNEISNATKKFTVQKEGAGLYAGGYGDLERPYLISNSAEFDNIRNYASSNFMLIKDVPLEAIPPIDSFSGVLDGNGFTLTGWKHEQTTVGNIGLFRENSGTIKNLTISDFTMYQNRPFVYGTLNVGFICGTNSGTLENIEASKCNLNVAIVVNHEDFRDTYNYINAGILCGYHTGTVTKCIVHDCTLAAYTYSKYQAAETHVGCLIGTTSSDIVTENDTENDEATEPGKVSDVASYGNTVIAKAAALNDGWPICKWHGRPYARAGGIIGFMQDTTIERALGYQNHLEAYAIRNCCGEADRDSSCGSIIGFKYADRGSWSGCYSEKADGELVGRDGSSASDLYKRPSLTESGTINSLTNFAANQWIQKEEGGHLSIARNTKLGISNGDREYFVGEPLNLDGVIIEAVKNDAAESRTEINGNFVVTGYDPNVTGTQTVTIAYGKISGDYTVTVKDPELCGIVLSSVPYKTTYFKPFERTGFEGENMDFTGLTVIAQFTDGTTAEVPFETLHLPDTGIVTQSGPVEVEYQGFSASYMIEAFDVSPIKLKVVEGTFKQNYGLGDAFDATGLEVQLTYNNGDTEILKLDDVTVDSSGFDGDVSGTYGIGIQYGTLKTSFDVLVGSVKRISIATLPDKLSYYSSEKKLVTDGLSINVAYDNGATKVVTTGFEVSGYDNNEIGTQDVTVTYGGASATFEVTVVAVEMTSVEITEYPKMTYFAGNVFTCNGLTLKVNYNDSSSKEITSGYTVRLDGYDTEVYPTLITLGKKNVLITYAEGGVKKTTQYQIEVVKDTIIDLQIVQDPNKLNYNLWDQFDHSGMMAYTVYASGKAEQVELSKNMFSVQTFTKSGTQTVLLNYLGRTAEIYCTVNAPSYISVSNLPTKTDYAVGETITTDGMQVIAYFADASEKVVDQALLSFTYPSTEIPGTYALIVKYELSANEVYSCTCDITVYDDGITLSGTITSFGDDEPVAVELWELDGTEPLYTTFVSNGTYTMEGVASGNYVLKFRKTNHVTREYEVTLDDGDAILDAKIHLIGDIDGNGKINTGDVAKLNAHLKGSNKLTAEYMILCANVNGGSLNMGDTAALYGHIKGTKKLY